jgi:hypothetical protein
MHARGEISIKWKQAHDRTKSRKPKQKANKNNKLCWLLTMNKGKNHKLSILRVKKGPSLLTPQTLKAQWKGGYCEQLLPRHLRTKKNWTDYSETQFPQTKTSRKRVSEYFKEIIRSISKNSLTKKIRS